MCDNSTIEFSDEPPIKMINQVGIMQNMGNYTFAAQFGADDCLQKITNLLINPDATKINRLPAPWREKFKCFSLNINNFLYMDERLVILKALRPIILHSPHYEHPGRECMLATVANVWWPRLHREVVEIAQTVPTV